jgi:hypothetical protein
LEDRHLLDASGPPTFPPLAHFTSVADFDAYFLAQAANQYKDLFGQPAPNYFLAPTTPFAQALLAPTGDSLPTNVMGGDIVASNGSNIFQISANQLIVFGTPGPGGLAIVSRTNIPWQSPGFAVAEFLEGNKLVIVSQIQNPLIAYAFQGGTQRGIQPWNIYHPRIEITVYDVSTPATPLQVQDELIDGDYAGGSVVGDHFYAALQNSTGFLPPPVPISDGNGGFVYESNDAYATRLLPHIPELILPHVYQPIFPGGGQFGLVTSPPTPTGLLSQPTDVYQPRTNNDGVFQSVLTVDLSVVGWGITDTETLLGGPASAFYATADHLYLAMSDALTAPGGPAGTIVQRFDLAGDHVLPGPAGFVPAVIELRSGALNEFNGDLRIAAASLDQIGSSSIYVLRQTADHLSVIGSLTGLAPNEYLYAALFVGNHAYLNSARPNVNFYAAIDPFFVIDLADPTTPRISGQVESPGITSELMALDSDHLLGIGTTGGFFADVQLTLYDVTNPENPRVLNQYEIRGVLALADSSAMNDESLLSVFPISYGQTTFSDATSDLRALSFFPDQQLVALPIVGALPYDGNLPELPSELFVFHVDAASGFQLAGRIQHDTRLTRSIFQDGYLYSIASGSTQVHALSNLTGQGHEVRANDLPRDVALLPFQAQPGQLFEGKLVDFILSDPTGLTAFIDWGDGISSPGQINAEVNGRLALSGQHNYLVLGTYTLTIAIERDGRTVATYTTTTRVGTLDQPGELFLRGLYLRLLDRVIEPAALNNLANKLEQGWSRQQVSSAVFSSTEYQAHQVNSLYQNVLRRPAEASGLQAWLSYLSAGHSLDDVRANLFGSDEYLVNVAGLSLATLISDLYVDILHRPAEPGGQLAWQWAVELGASRADVSRAIMHSAEGAHQTITQAFVTNLNRLPEEQAIDFFTTRIAGGASYETINAAVLGSQEFFEHLSNY